MILLDTHVLVWLDGGSSRLGSKARRAINETYLEEGLAVSAITFWEVGTLQRKGRLDLAMDLGSWRMQVLEAGVVEIPVNGDIGALAATLEAFHADPADRMIVATALRDGACLCTADRRILDWPGPIQRRDARE